MKQITLFTLGLTLTGAAVLLPFTKASPQAYHAYMTQPQNIAEYRHFAEGVPRNRQYTRRSSLRQRSHYAQPRSYRATRENFQRSFSPNPNLAVRTSTNRVAPLHQNTARTGYQPRVVITPTLSAQVRSSLYTYENDAFSLLLPTGWSLTSNEGNVHTYRNAGQGYELNVKHFAPGTCAESLGFTACAVQLSKAENYLAVDGGRLDITTKVNRSSRMANTVLNRIGVQTSTYTEQFNGSSPTAGERTYTRYFVAAPDGGVFLVEATVPFNQGGAYTEVTKRVFDSFRLYPTD